MQSTPTPSTFSQVLTNPGSGGYIDELVTFGGQTSVLYSKLLVQGPREDRDGTKNKSATTTELLAMSMPPSHPSTHSVSSSPSPTGTQQSSASAGTRPSSVEQEDVQMTIENVHPSLLEYMAMLSSTTFPNEIHEHPNAPLAQSSPSGIASQSSSIPQSLESDASQPWQLLAEPSVQQQTNQLSDALYDPELFGTGVEHFYREATPIQSGLGDSDMCGMKDIRDIDTLVNDLKGDGAGWDDGQWTAFINWSG